MMTSILNLETCTQEGAPPGAAVEPQPAAADYEIVLGRAQIASWLFVGVIAVAVCASLAYLAGESVAVKKAALTARVAPPPPLPAPLPQASLAGLPVKESPKPAAPLFAEPALGKVYVQIAAVDRGMAMLLADGLRSHHLASFVAPGPNQKIFRVLIGPLADPEAFRQAMGAVTSLDLANFARKYEK